MRWPVKPPKATPKTGDLRAKTAFLWLPRHMDGEWRWLEKASWQQLCMVSYDCHFYEWLDHHWCDNNKCPHGYEDWDQCAVCCH